MLLRGFAVVSYWLLCGNIHLLRSVCALGFSQISLVVRCSAVKEAIRKMLGTEYSKKKTHP